MNRQSYPKPHLVLIPLMAQGHMIPMIDMARLLADQGGALVTFITTPVNAARIRPAIESSANLPIHFVELQFPSAEAGLPDGCENLDLINDIKLLKPFIEALPLLAKQLELHLRQHALEPADCIISDSTLPWTAAVARSLGVPRIVFHGPSCFYLYCSELIKHHAVLGSITDDYDPVVLPELPHRVEIAKAQAERWVDSPAWAKLRDDYYAAEAAADGVVMNTFQELEDWYVESYRKVTGKKVWTIGPLSLHNRDISSKAARGNNASVDTQQLQRWLDAREKESVIFASFGSLARNSLSQLVEIGCGLEAAGVPFLWVVKEVELKSSPEAGKWMDEFEERVSEKMGLVIRGWAPQVVVLSHPAVGGFLTHCGWNSTLEAISAGVPMVTWPHFSDQFLNERLVEDVLGIGVAVGATVPATTADEKRKELGMVKREAVERAVVRLMDGGEEGEERRRRAREFGEKAREAMGEGGSSNKNLREFIHYVVDHART